MPGGVTQCFQPGVPVSLGDTSAESWRFVEILWSSTTVTPEHHMRVFENNAKLAKSTGLIVNS